MTFQNKSNSYLKLGLYYNQKFVLYYFDGENLYSKSFIHYNDAFPFIKYFFDNGYVNREEYKKENMIFKNIEIHFLSQNFIYTVTLKRIYIYLRNTSFLEIIFLIVITAEILFHLEKFTWKTLFILIPMFFLGGMNILLFFNYLKFSKNKVLIMSKGNDVFSYGDKDELQEYNKNDIEEVVTYSAYHPQGSRQLPWVNFKIISIRFKSNIAPITISNLLVNQSALIDKLYNIPQTEVRMLLPFLKEYKL